MENDRGATDQRGKIDAARYSLNDGPYGLHRAPLSEPGTGRPSEDEVRRWRERQVVLQ